MKKQNILPFVIVLMVVVAFFSAVFTVGFVFTYNGLVKARARTDEAKAQIETVCQRRLDLVPNLVAAVKGYAKHEKETLVAVTAARNNAQAVLDQIVQKKHLTEEEMAVLATSQSELTKTLKSLFALTERYPDLKASTNFLVLQDQLEGTENRISVARQRYNTSLRSYNTKIATFPGNILASMFGFQSKDHYFEAKQEAKEPVQVKF